jgi:hypothetical protein
MSKKLPTIQVIRELLKDREKFLQQTRFDLDNMKKLWSACKSRDQSVSLKKFLETKDVQDIFQVQDHSPLANHIPVIPADIPKPERYFQDVNRRESGSFKEIERTGIPQESQLLHCSEFLCRASGILHVFLLFDCEGNLENLYVNTANILHISIS